MKNTRSTVLDLAKSHKHHSMVGIAEEVGVSRERVRQILRSENIADYTSKTRFKKPHYCSKCGNVILVNNGRYAKLCVDCRHMVNPVTWPCDYCGCPVTRKYYHRKRFKNGELSGLVFCNKQCQGLWLGTRRKRKIDALEEIK